MIPCLQVCKLLVFDEILSQHSFRFLVVVVVGLEGKRGIVKSISSQIQDANSTRVIEVGEIVPLVADSPVLTARWVEGNLCGVGRRSHLPGSMGAVLFSLDGALCNAALAVIVNIA